MKILIACESSGTVRNAFRLLGHDAYSCDLLPEDNPTPYHIQGDALEALEAQPWDMLIAHPPCTYLTSSAEWAYGPGPYHQRVKPSTLVGEARQEARTRAIAFFMALFNAPIPKIAIENPVGVMSRVIPPSQVIQPHDFGENASKRTCLWLKNLPDLVPTLEIPPDYYQDGNPRRPRWANQTPSGGDRSKPGDLRWKSRSNTYKGVANAMAAQWG